MVFTQNNAISWQNTASGEIGAWNLSDGKYASGNLFDDLKTSGNVRLKAAARLNGDNVTDLVFQNVDTGEIGIAYSKAGGGFDRVALTDNPGANWKVAGAGDFYGKGTNDLFLVSDDGQAAVWGFNGVQRNAPISGAFVTGSDGKAIKFGPGTGWNAVGVADFSGDGKVDVLWQNKVTGDVGFWEMNGDKLTSPKLMDLTGVGISKSALKSWDAVGVGDFNNDGKADILWKKDGFVGSWQMNNETFVSAQKIGDAPAGWNVAVSSFDKSVANPLAQYKGQTQNIQLNFSNDAPLSASDKAGLINLAGIVEQALGGRTNLPQGSTFKITVDKSLVEFVENPVATPPLVP